MRRGTIAAACALLCLGTVLVFLPLRQAEFINYDDDMYVTSNALTMKGLSWDGFVWAWTNAKFNWHPLTWLSHMLDCQLFGLNAGAHHLSSLALHGANSALLLYLLLRLTGAFWASVFVAALFALHPLHVEPVAWIAARKDLLSTWWWFAALLAYVRYTERRTRVRYGLIGMCLVLSLLHKGMAVTLPLMCLLLDYWPLQRWPAAPTEHGPAAGTTRNALPVRVLLLEKLPLFLIALAGMAVQILAQRWCGALVPLDRLPLPHRLANATVAYTAYIVKMLWPADLALPYPLPPGFPPSWQIVASLTSLLGVSVIVATLGRRRRYLVTGWLWYLITLLPVIGLVQIGWQSMADRYTYVPLVGLFLAIAWGIADLGRNHPLVRATLPAAAGLIILACAILSRIQIGYWHDSLTLFRHTAAVTTNNVVAEVNGGRAADKAGLGDEALRRLTAALRIDPASATAHYGLAEVLIRHGQLAAAETHLREAERLRPDAANSLVENNLGVALKEAGQDAAARAHFAAAVAIDPGNAEAQNNLGAALAAAGQPAAAEAYFREAVRLQPQYVSARVNLGLARLEQGDLAGAREHFAAAIALDPRDAALRDRLAQTLQAADRNAADFHE